MNTTENNKLIAEFMGVNVNSNGTFELSQFGSIRPNGNFKTEFEDSQLKYHTSWDWLMPVVEKIEDMGCEITQTNGECTISGNEYYEETYGNNRRHATFDAVVEFIKWYNENK